MLGSGKILRTPLLDLFERQDALPQIAVDHRIIALADNLSQTVWWKLVYGEVAHGFPSCIELPEVTASGRQEARQTISG